jgi:AraC-like DNA-binding protein
LRRALDRIADGCTDLTGLALDLGFSSHSHFTATFRKHLGITPEAVRSVTRAGDFASLRRRLAALPAASGN